jgi:signal transduction histidine kinase
MVKRSNSHSEAHVGNRNAELERECSTAVFRIFQETLTNVARHSEATKVKVKLKHYHNGYKLEVSDNGKGISNSDISAPQLLGLLGIKEKALLFGGDVDIVGKTGKGTKVSIIIPIRRYTAERII